MKRKFVYILVCFVVSAGLLVNIVNQKNTASIKNELNNQKNTASIKNELNNGSGFIMSESQKFFTFQNIDELIGYADTIVIGKVKDEIEFSDTTTKYSFAVDKSLKGSAGNTLIYIYETKGTLIPNGRYLLFMARTESSLYPESCYTSIEKETIAEIDNNGNFTKNAKYIDSNLNEDKIVKYIENSSSVKTNTNKMAVFDIKDKAESIEELISASDYILQIIPRKITNYNIYVSGVSATIIKQYKGESLNGETPFLLPPNLCTGNEYIIFLKERNKSLTPTVRMGGIVSKEDATEWGSVMKKLQE